MKRRSTTTLNARAFRVVAAVGLTLPDVAAATRYDGSPILRIHGVFLAGLATHPSAAPDTLVVRSEIDDRELLLADAPDTYYVTDYYRPYPIVLVRLAAIDRDALRDLLSISRRLAEAKTRRTSKRLKRESAPVPN